MSNHETKEERLARRQETADALASAGYLDSPRDKLARAFVALGDAERDLTHAIDAIDESDESDESDEREFAKLANHWRDVAAVTTAERDAAWRELAQARANNVETAEVEAENESVRAARYLALGARARARAESAESEFDEPAFERLAFGALAELAELYSALADAALANAQFARARADLGASEIAEIERAEIEREIERAKGANHG